MLLRSLKKIKKISGLISKIFSAEISINYTSFKTFKNTIFFFFLFPCETHMLFTRGCRKRLSVWEGFSATIDTITLGKKNFKKKKASIETMFQRKCLKTGYMGAGGGGDTISSNYFHPYSNRNLDDPYHVTEWVISRTLFIFQHFWRL